MNDLSARGLPPPDDVASPCTKVCEMDAGTGLCRGCFRTLDEIVVWGALDAQGKRNVLSMLPGRRARHAPR